MKKFFKKNKFKKIVVGLFACLMFCFPIVLSGCDFIPTVMGGDNSNGSLSLDGVKVLRRPGKYEHYNDDYGDGVTEEKTYFYLFSENIFKSFERIYGTRSSVFEADPRLPGYNELLPNGGINSIYQAIQTIVNNQGIEYVSEKNQNDDEGLKYFYDAIRYQITSEFEKPVYKVDDPETTEDESQQVDYTYVEVTADTSKGWNWVQNYNAFMYDTVNIETLVYSDYLNIKNPGEKGNIEDKIINNDLEEFNVSEVNNYYSIISTSYSSIFVDSNFIYTLGYAIYCIVLGFTPNDAGWSSDGVTWTVEGYEAKDGKQSSQVAFETLKESFENSGSYVGLTSKNKKDIANYILKNVIGDDAVNASNHTDLGYNLYYEDVVNAVVEYCGKLTQTGIASSTGDGEASYVGDAFMASELVDFEGTKFFISQSEDTTKEDYERAFENIESCEYQSVIIMPDKVVDLTDLWLDFMYIAKDGKGNYIADEGLYIDITVIIRWWDGSVMRTINDDIHLRNGVYDAGGESTLDFSFYNSKDPSVGFGMPARIGKFECEELNTKGKFILGDGISKITLTGEVDARHYYEVVNSSDGFGSYGRLKQSKVGNMPYLEINFDVHKTSLSENRGYDFYVGISNTGYTIPEV